MLSARVVVVDQERAARQALQRTLETEPRLQVAASAGTVQEALNQIEVHHPQVMVVADVLPGLRGLTLTAALRRQRPKIGVVLLVEWLDIEASATAVETGAAGLISRGMPGEEALQTIVAVAENSNPIHARAMAEPEIMARLLAGVRAGSADDLSVGPYDPGVSLHLLGVLDEVVRGMTNREMSVEEGMSERTVKRNVSTLMAVLGVRDRIGILREALSHRWVSIYPEAIGYGPPWQPSVQHGAGGHRPERRAPFGMKEAGWLPAPGRA
ncbi:MAG: response regulator transcription factor [Thermomicrobiales bacterium]